MKVRIDNLPAGVTDEDIRELLDNSDDVRQVELIEEGDDENPVAVVELASEAAAEGTVNLINGRTWKNVILRANKLLY